MIGTEIDYLYRDAGNYKFRGAIVVSGKVLLEQLKPFLFDQTYFIPDAVGIKRLIPTPMTQDDHELHEFVSFHEIDTDRFEMRAEDLLIRFEFAAKKGWFEWRG